MGVTIDNLDYNTVATAILDYYKTDPTAWRVLNEYGYPSDEIYPYLQNIPNVTVNRTLDGTITGYVDNSSYVLPLAESESVANAINSNTAVATADRTLTGSFASTIDTASGQMSSGSVLASSGSKVFTVAKALSLGLTAVTAGARLGKFFAKETYQSNPDYWDEQLPTINPETWKSIATEGSTGQKLINWLFGLDENGNTTAYMDSDAFAYMAYALNQLGAFSTGDSVVNNTSSSPYPELAQYSCPVTMVNGKRIEGNVNGRYAILNSNNPIYGYKYVTPNNTYYDMWFVSNGKINDITMSGNPEGFSQQSFYWYHDGVGERIYYISGQGYKQNSLNPTIPDYYNTSLATNMPLNWSSKLCINIAKSGVISTPSMPGTSDQPDTTKPDTSTWTDPQATDQSLKQQYPSLYDNAVYNDVPQSDGTVKRKTYVPVPTIGSTSATMKDPTNTTITQDQQAINPTTAPSDLLNTLLRYVTNTQTQTTSETPTVTTSDNPPVSGSGNTPSVILPSGSASSLWAVYNPTQAQVNQFGAWLWSSDFIEQIKKLFNNPMDGIIGIHKVFATPPTSGSATIKCGYIDSGVSSAVVSNQYTTVNCGTVSLREYFGNVFDYAPFTDVRLFLPFIGVVDLDVSDVMRASISVKYHVDVITGACLAEVSISRDGSGGILYTYGGSCIVSYPISSGSYIGAVGGVLSTISSAVGMGASIASGNPMGMIMGASGVANSLGGIRANVQHSGGFTGASAVMGGKKPYLIVSRPQSEIANNANVLIGYPSNKYVKLSSATGFVKVKAVHADNIDIATKQEMLEIESLLKNGVLVN